MICCVHVIYISLCCGGQFIDGGHTHGVGGGNQRVSMNPSPLKTKKDLGWTMVINVWNLTPGHKAIFNIHPGYRTGEISENHSPATSNGQNSSH
jgi:hypothetical protein